MEDINLLKYKGKIYNLDSFSNIQNILKSITENQKKQDILIHGDNPNNINEIHSLEKNGFLNEFLNLRKKVEELEKLVKKTNLDNSSCSSSFNSSNSMAENDNSSSNSSMSSSNNSNFYSYCSNDNNSMDNDLETISIISDTSDNSASFNKNCVLFLENEILNISEIQNDENYINDNDVDENYDSFFNIFKNIYVNNKNYSYLEDQEIKYEKKFKNLKYLQKQYDEKFIKMRNKMKNFQRNIKECQRLIKRSTNFTRNTFVTVKDFNDLNRIRNKFYRVYSKEIKNFGDEKIKNKDEYRDLIFEIAESMYHDEADKITDMIIKNDEAVLNDMVYNVPEFLKETIMKAHNLIQDRNKKYKLFS